MQRYFIYLQFDGTAYHGWQIQPNGISVQEILLKAVSTLLRKETPITGAGRTDTGVHARMMTAHFDTEETLDTKLFAYKLNRMLPKDIAIDSVVAVENSLHARFSAQTRTYHYYIHKGKMPFRRRFSAEFNYNIDFDLMNEAAKILLETKDFASFCKSHNDAKTTFCNVIKASWIAEDERCWFFEITADRFLRNMVRAVVGTLLDVGRKKISISQFRQIVNSHKRTEAGESVPACGLFLWKIEY